jgi:hypothetical protein
MKKHRRRVLVLGFIIFGSSIFWVVVQPIRPPATPKTPAVKTAPQPPLTHVPRFAAAITRASFNRIQLRMTREQVEGVLGGPPGLYAGGKEFCEANCGPYIPLAMGADLGDPSVKLWFGRDIAVGVRFDEANRVIWKAAYPDMERDLRE